jgi:hypothetical protein
MDGFWQLLQAFFIPTMDQAFLWPQFPSYDTMESLLGILWTVFGNTSSGSFYMDNGPLAGFFVQLDKVLKFDAFSLPHHVMVDFVLRDLITATQLKGLLSIRNKRGVVPHSYDG